MCTTALGFRKFAQIGVAPSVHLERVSEWTCLKTRRPLHSAVQRLIRILTDTMPDYRPQPIETTPTLRWFEIAVKLSRRRGDRGGALRLDL